MGAYFAKNPTATVPEPQEDSIRFSPTISLELSRDDYDMECAKRQIQCLKDEVDELKRLVNELVEYFIRSNSLNIKNQTDI